MGESERKEETVTILLMGECERKEIHVHWLMRQMNRDHKETWQVI